jgi:hypothetical protein
MSGRSRTYNLEFAIQLLYHLHHHYPLLSMKSFIIKVNHAQKHTTSKCSGVRWEPWTFEFPVFRSTT